MSKHTESHLFRGPIFMRILLAALLALVLAVPAHAQSWFEAETAHFIIKSRDGEEETRAFAEQVERFDRGLRFLNGLDENDVEESRANKPVIYRFGSYNDMARMAGAPGSGIAGFFISRAGRSVSFVPTRGRETNNSRERRGPVRDNPNEVLFHEYTHYFMMQHFPAAYPRWYSEGYAEMLSTMRFLDGGAFHLGDPPQGRAAQIFQMPDFRLHEMLDSNHQLSGRDAYQHYGTGWLLTHYLSFNIDREQALRRYLIALGNGADSLTTAQDMFGDLRELERTVDRYKDGPFPGYDVRPNNTDAPSVTMRQLSEAEVALIQIEMRLQVGVDRADAENAAGDLRAVIARFPQSSAAHRWLAEAEYDSRNYVASEQAAARAVELDPANVDALIYRAMAAIELAKSDPAYLRTARQHLSRAAELDDQDPRSMILYYQTHYDETQGQPPEHAIIALEQALDSAGSDAEYRLLLGRQLVIEERYNDARIVLLPALYQGHSIELEDADAPTPQGVLDAIGASDRTTALDLLGRMIEPEDEDEA